MFKWLNKLFKPKLTTIPEMVRFLKKKELNIHLRITLTGRK